jgi:NADH-quinone oxidoreductase subunit N
VSEFYSSADHLALLPGLMPALFGCAILLLRFFGKSGSRAPFWVALLGLAFTALALGRQQMWLLDTHATELIGFHGALTVDAFALYFNWLFTGMTALVILASKDVRAEYFALLLFAQCGMFFLAAGTDLVTLFVGLELMAVSFYALTAFGQGDRRSTESAIKYLLLGAFSSAILVYGFSMLFGLAGSTLLSDISGAAGARSPRDPLLLIAIAAITVGLLFKISAAPFHMWAPDAYEGAPTAIAAHLSVASKAASFALLLRLLPGALNSARETWMPLLMAAAVLTLTVGNLAAITQTNIKRLLAYSSIAHAGYMLLGIVAGNPLGRDGLAIYLFMYGISNAGAFAVVIALEHGRGRGEDISDLAGLMRKSPAYALALLLFLLSLAGIPPAAGFWGKYYIALALMQTGHYALALIAVAYIAVSCFYYFRIVRFLFLQPQTDAEVPRASWSLALAITTCGAITLAAGLYPEPVLRFASGAIR